MLVIDHSRSSPNFSSRNGQAITCIVMHATAGSYQSALTQLTSPVAKVSSHYLISKTGIVAQLVADDQAAWHAGVSSWMGLGSQDIQERSIGIELANANTGRDPYPPIQLAQASLLCIALIGRYQVSRAMFVRHLDIALPAGRKTDPAGFPWKSFVDSLYPPPPPPIPVVQHYQTRGLPVYERQDLTGETAGFLTTGESVEINMLYSNGAGHVSGGRLANAGFVDMKGLVNA